MENIQEIYKNIKKKHIKIILNKHVNMMYKSIKKHVNMNIVRAFPCLTPQGGAF